MKIAYIPFMIVFSFLSSANAGNWIPQSGHNWEKAYNSEEFAKLQAKFPEYLSEFDPTIVAYAEFEYQLMAYVGETTCPANDPRLQSMRGHYSVCVIGQTGYCPTAYYLPGYGDPCRYGADLNH